VTRAPHSTQWHTQRSPAASKLPAHRQCARTGNASAPPLQVVPQVAEQLRQSGQVAHPSLSPSVDQSILDSHEATQAPDVRGADVAAAAPAAEGAPGVESESEAPPPLAPQECNLDEEPSAPSPS
jgi:hypothetical protein